MKKTLMVLGLGLVFFVYLFIFKSTSSSQQTITQEYVPNEVLVKFKPEAGKQKALTALDALKPRVVNYLGKEIAFTDWNPEVRTKSSFLGDPYLVHLRVPETVGTEKAISMLKNNPNVEYAEPNYIYMTLQTIPNDPDFSKLWGLSRIRASQAWDIFTGSSEIIVAVIDTGIDYNHIDLAENIWVNTREVPNNGIDDDNNGYKDDYRGWNFYSDNNNPIDDHYAAHGTHVAGTIGAIGNNNIGVVGVNWNVKLMALKIMDSLGYTTNSRIVKAIDYAYQNGAKISNNSYGGLPYSQSVYNAISRAGAAGHLFIAAAGNYGTGLDWYDNDIKPVYPASYSCSNIIAVLATDYFDQLASYSHYGKNSVDVGAPGGTADPMDREKDIYSTLAGDFYGYMYGTSMASPHVAGVAALLFGRCYPYITDTQVKRRILEKVDELSSLNGKCVSNGRINAYKVLYDPATPNAPSDLSGYSTGWTVINLSWVDNSTNEMGFKIERKLSGMVDYTFIKAVDVNQTSSFDGTAQGGEVNFYRVKSWNMAGDSEPSIETSVLIPATAPSAPAALRGGWDRVRQAVALNWTDMSNNELSFIVERKAEWETQWTGIASVGQNLTSYYDPDVLRDAFCYYRIKVWNPVGSSSYSNEFRVYVPPIY
jgi:subtilisin family serine protease